MTDRSVQISRSCTDRNRNSEHYAMRTELQQCAIMIAFDIRTVVIEQC